jgi:hypothetical protein
MPGGETGRGQAVASGQSSGGFRGAKVGSQVVRGLRLGKGRLDHRPART